MRIPDEGKYKEGSIRIEEVDGYQSCIHCVNCGLTHLNQIFTDGTFFCFHFEIWKRGDDIYEFKCPGFRQKNCNDCWIKSKFKCSRSEEISNPSEQFCNKFVYKRYPSLRYMFAGRIRRLPPSTNGTAVWLEAEYAERKRDRLIEEGIDVSSIKDIEFKGKIENINKSKDLFKSWGGNRFPSYVKGIKSKSQLNKQLNKFFEEHPIEQGDRPPKVNELAIYLGFASERDLFRIIEDISPDRDMEVQALIARAVGMIQNAYNDLIINLALVEGDYKGIANVLDRQERIADKYAKKFEDAYKDVPKMEVNVTMDDKLKDLLNSRLNGLSKTIDAKFEDVKPQQLDAPKAEGDENG